jgi:hypothetical protein
MKKIFTIVAVILLTGTAIHAQFNKGDKLFGGSFAANARSQNDQSTQTTGSNIGFSPSVAWVVKKDISMGIRGGINFNSSKQERTQPTAESRSISINPGVFVTRYKKLKDKFGVTFTHDLSVGFNEQTNISGSIKTKINSRSVRYAFNPGVFYRFSETITGQADIGGLNASWFTASGIDNFSANASFLQSFAVGINYRIAKK